MVLSHRAKFQLIINFFRVKAIFTGLFALVTYSDRPQERLPKQALHAKANGRRPVGRPRTRWTDYIEDLGWNRLGLRPSEMMEVVEDREVWRLNLELLPPQPSRKSGQ